LEKSFGSATDELIPEVRIDESEVNMIHKADTLHDGEAEELVEDGRGDSQPKLKDKTFKYRSCIRKW